MAPDFFPLDVGNVWRYDVVDPEGNSYNPIQFEIQDYTIVEGTSFYVFSRFPFGPSLPADGPVGIRYDRQERGFIWFDGTNSQDLFPSLGASAEVLETDDNGLPFRALFRFGDLVLTLERGVGIVQAGFVGPNGPRVASLVGARVAGSVVGVMEAAQPELRVRERDASTDLPIADPIDEATTPSETRPELTLEARVERDGHRFVLTVRNPSDRLLGFDFDSSQSFDFVVVDPASTEEVWRWSQRRFFSQVVRSEAIRPGGQWTFEGEWNHRDSGLTPVDPGIYEVFGILTAKSPIESDSIRVQVQ